MIFIPRRKVVVLCFFVVLFAFSIAFMSKNTADVSSGPFTKRIIIDAGHGLPDGGAVGKMGSIESTLNLEIAKATQKKLTDMGYTVIMTRNDENTIADEGKTIGEKKKNDMHKRLEIINSSDADVFVSIHMNKFSDGKYRGAQVIYSGNMPSSQTLASLIQDKLVSLPDNVEKRVCAKGNDSIFLLKHSPIPSVIVECGFLSNFDEEELLNTKEYRNSLATAIADGINSYYKSEGSKKE